MVARAHGQESSSSLDFGKEPILPPQILWDSGSRAGSEGFLGGRTSPARLFRMPAGYLTDPVGLDSEDDSQAASGDGLLPPGAPSGTGMDSRVEAAIGSDNPFFDFRAPGDPGGVGYYKLHAQYQLVGDRFSSLCLGFQAFSPAGLEGDGLLGGPTFFSPNLAWYHEWASGLALHGFVGKTLSARAGWVDELGGRVHYGLAIESPLPVVPACPRQCLHVFVEALGSSPRLSGTLQNRPSTVGVIPGLYWQLRDNWWMSSGVALPLGNAPRYENGLLQITCSWRF
jgi:hypothetical protein